MTTTMHLSCSLCIRIDDTLHVVSNLGWLQVVPPGTPLFLEGLVKQICWGNHLKDRINSLTVGRYSCWEQFCHPRRTNCRCFHQQGFSYFSIGRSYLVTIKPAVCSTLKSFVSFSRNLFISAGMLIAWNLKIWAASSDHWCLADWGWLISLLLSGNRIWQKEQRYSPNYHGALDKRYCLKANLVLYCLLQYWQSVVIHIYVKFIDSWLFTLSSVALHWLIEKVLAGDNTAIVSEKLSLPYPQIQDHLGGRGVSRSDKTL